MKSTTYDDMPITYGCVLNVVGLAVSQLQRLIIALSLTCASTSTSTIGCVARSAQAERDRGLEGAPLARDHRAAACEISRCTGPIFACETGLFPPGVVETGGKA